MRKFVEFDCEHEQEKGGEGGRRGKKGGEGGEREDEERGVDSGGGVFVGGTV